MKLPWLKFYPSDWLSDEALRGCSPAARGLWVDMICLMAKSKKHGYLLAGDKPMGAEHIARIFGESLERTSELLVELAQAGVYSMEQDTIFSRRMVKDEGSRKSNRDRILRWRNGNVTHDVTEMKRSCNANVTPQKSEATEARSQKPDIIKENKFIAPTLEEWIAYGKEKYPEMPGLEVEKIWVFYENKSWHIGKTKAKNWKLCFRTCYITWKQKRQSESKLSSFDDLNFKGQTKITI